MDNKDIHYLIQKIEKADLPELKTLALENGGNKKMHEHYFEHVYFKNPSNSKSLWKVIVNKAIEGFATTNNFKFTLDGNNYLVAMPQNVLTSVKLRGKGLFNKLYSETERDNIENNKVDFFMTFTNKLSTPIFLNKFGYLKGKCPDLLIFISNPFDLLSKRKYHRIASIDSIKFNTDFKFNNSFLKSAEFFLWRYKLYDINNLHIISITENEIIIGYAFFIVEKKKSIKFLILSDIISFKQENLNLIIKQCKIYTTKNYFAFLMMFDLNIERTKDILTFTFKDRFNFLVKGKISEESKMLSTKSFNLFFSDIDII